MSIVRSESTWQRLVTAPEPGRHIAHLHVEPGFLVRTVTQFVADGLRRDDGVIVVAIPFHWRAVASRLEQQSFDLEGVCRRRQLTVLDAADCLTGMLVDGMPDRERFIATIGGAVQATKAAGYDNVRAFGEMVDLLRHTSPAGMLRLEARWNELLRDQRLSLLCGYSVDVLDPRVYGGLLQQVSSVHSDVIPVEDVARLDHAVKSAYADVFGGADDAGGLREAFARHYSIPAAMPDAQAAILAVHEFVPSAADMFLSRVRYHYRSDNGRAGTTAG